MSEFLSQSKFEQDKPPLDRGEVIDRLLGFGADIEPADLEGMDDNEVLGIIATYAAMLDINEEEVTRYVVPIEDWKDNV